jgi:hypothetical protein
VRASPEFVSNRSAVFALFNPLNFGLVGQSVPAVVSLGCLAKLWWAGELYGVQQAAFVAWFVTALAVQLASESPGMWIAGYVGQVALAIVLVLKDQIDDFLN